MDDGESFESDDDAVACASHVPVDAAPRDVEGRDEYGSDKFEVESSEEEYADESFEPPPSPLREPREVNPHATSQPSSTPVITIVGTCDDRPTNVEELSEKSSSAIHDPTSQHTAAACTMNLQSFVASKMQKLSTEPCCSRDTLNASASQSVLVPMNLLHRLQMEPLAPQPISRRQATTSMCIPAAIIDRVRIQTLLSTMSSLSAPVGAADDDNDVLPHRRSLFTFVARHISRLQDRRWAAQLDALEAKTRQAHDTLGWIAHHMQRHRAAYT
ncbi:hypothetical protein AaE_013827 [Aphanomyces astaci]|uniref:Uncharacterized protein n=1 Tax=Aphanomyces astaci TaxID=112090 RepID=A0A6A4Z3Q8_APHAT|nr:hypothetical protein AaE_013827 [Aphanomyces astaci]